MITTTEISKQYIPESATNTFAFDIPYFVDADINVEAVDSEGLTTVLILDAVIGGFTVSPVNGDSNNGCTITTSEEYSSGTITIYRLIPITQENEFVRGGDLPPDVLNSSFDRSVAISQQINNSSARHISLPITDPEGLSYELPNVSLRANKVIGFDETGEPITVDIGSGGTIGGVNTGAGLEAPGGIASCKVDNETLEFDIFGNIVVKTITNEQLGIDAVETDNIKDGAVTLSKLADDFIGQIYPIGSIYTNANVPTNPGTLLGVGTWISFGSGKVLIGIDSTAVPDIDFDTAGATGGEKEHTLTIDEMPSHSHGSALQASGDNYVDKENNDQLATTTALDSAGGDLPHNNLQPYIVVYMWVRTA